MIKRTSSKIVTSLVNSSHEEHFNVSNAIRDDAPITDASAVVKSINFETDRDGAYILRKPLVRKNYNTPSTILLSNKTDFLHRVMNTITIDNASTIILKFYDNHLTLHEYSYSSSMLADWLEIISTYNTPDATIMSVNINHETFLRHVGYSENTNFDWKLNNDLYTVIGYNHWGFIKYPILKRLLKIYESLDQENTYIIEIITPELNTFTTSLDTGNSAAFDVNLLLDNSYAARDLYNYGYVSGTKILAYTYNYPSDDITRLKNFRISTLTELGPYINEYDIADGFSLLVSSNPKVFNKKYLILKAFLTTAVTNSKYYCCWEVSKDDGATWEDCPEFLSKHRSEIVRKKVVDITYKNFTDALENESLEESNTYLVEKGLVPMNLSTDWLSIDNTIGQRPDVLILEYPNLSYKYRFLIYASNNNNPVASSSDIVEGTNFEADMVTVGYDYNAGSELKMYSSGSDFHAGSSQANIQVTVKDRLGGDTERLYGGTSSDAYVRIMPTSSNSGATSSYTYTEDGISKKYPGCSIEIKAKTGYLIKSVKVTAAAPFSYYSNRWLGNTLGVSSEIHPTLEGNPYDLAYIETVESSEVYGWKPLWVNTLTTKTFYAPEYSENPDKIVLTNLNTCLSDAEASEIIEEYRTEGDTQPHSLLRELVIKQIRVTYCNEADYCNTYLASSTGTFQISYSKSTEYADYTGAYHDRLFAGKFYYNENQAQLLVYSGNYVYVSGTNSAIMKLMNSLTLPETITKIVPWRGYLLLFSPRNIYLAKYDAESDTYNLKTLSNSVGVPSIDADTIVPILNSIYFKSGNKIFRLVPNLYAASDDILNVHQISIGINSILEDIVNNITETHNFSYADADTYSLFIPVSNSQLTYCITYDFNTKLWTMQTYPIVLDGIEKISNLEVYVTHNSGWYYFKESFKTLLALGLQKYKENTPSDTNEYDIDFFYNALQYADYVVTPAELISYVIAPSTHQYVLTKVYPIPFLIDFGQKSSNYTVDKQFLETKLILATLSAKDTFPLTLDIYTDGLQFKELHWDANTDSALWKNALTDIGTLNTDFYSNESDFNGILRQLIVKYSGRGKSIRHIISGESKTLFKFYSMDVRARILPKKQ